MITEELETAAQAVHYLLHKMGALNQLKVIKMIFLADKYHLLHMGRTITGDTYIAMEHGPVPSLVRNLVYRIEDYLPEEARGIPDQFFTLGPNYMIESKDAVDYDLLSVSDRAAIDFVISKFGELGYKKLLDYVHTLPEWKKHAPQIEWGAKFVPMNKVDMFSVLNDVDMGISREDAQEAHDLFVGRE